MYAQVKDKAVRKAEEAARQRSLDAAMEADRVAALCQYEVRSLHAQTIPDCCNVGKPRA